MSRINKSKNYSLVKKTKGKSQAFISGFLMGVGAFGMLSGSQAVEIRRTAVGDLRSDMRAIGSDMRKGVRKVEEGNGRAIFRGKREKLA